MDVDATETVSRGAVQALEPRVDDAHSQAADCAPARGLLDLPSELLSQIASYLPLQSLIALTLLHSSFRALAQSRVLTPFAAPVLTTILAGSPYPRDLALLAGTHPYLPSAVFINILVRAQPRFILEELEIPRWSEEMWREAFDQRFLPSWKRYRGQGETWRGTFLRILRRLEHRASGCTHDESWTRFLTLHRNGSASINRIYSRNFDPMEIFEELKLQNNLAGQPTQIRLVCQLQDVRILALGVLYSPTSLFVNHNAHDLLHPPLLRLERPMTPPPDPRPMSGNRISFPHEATPGPSSRSNQQTSPNCRASENAVGSDSQANGAPLSRSISMSTTDSRTHRPPLARSPTSLISSTLASLLPGVAGRARRQSEATAPGTASNSLGGRLTRIVSGGSASSGAAPSLNRRRTFSFGRTRSNVVDSTHVAPPEPVDHARSDDDGGHTDLQSDGGHTQTSTNASTDPSPTFEYRPMLHPTPAPGHRYYPNHTPGGADLRIEHLEGAQVETGYNDGAKTEWDDGNGDRSWVGPMLLIAQLHASDSVPMPFDGPASIVELGAHGTYASLGFEDLEAIAGWVTLVDSDPLGLLGHPGARRDGLGFGS